MKTLECARSGRGRWSDTVTVSERRLGIAAGQIAIADDLDAPLPDEVLDAFEGRLGSDGLTE